MQKKMWRVIVQQLNQKHQLRFFFFWLFSGILEYPFFLVIFNYQEQLFLSYGDKIWLMHMLAIVLMFFSVPKGVGWFHHERTWPRTFAILMFFLPVLGWLFSGVLFFTYRHPEDAKNVLIDLDDEENQFAPFYENRTTLPSFTHSRKHRLFKKLDFMPLADILRSEDASLKRGAIEKLALLATPEAIEVLLSHRSDQQPEVRFYVTSALTKVKSSLEEELDAAKNELKQHPESSERRFYLAKIYLKYVQSGLLDEGTSETYLNESLYHLNKLIENHYHQPEVYWVLIEIYNNKRDWQQALQALNALESVNHENDFEIMKMRAHIYYNLKDYHLLRKELQKLKKAGLTDPKWEAATFLWGVQA